MEARELPPRSPAWPAPTAISAIAAIAATAAVALVLLAPAPTNAAVQTYSSAPAAVIPEALPPGPGTPQSVTDTITINDSGSINDVNVSVTFQHPEINDIGISLTDPSGAVTVVLISTEIGPGDGFSNVTFDDEAPGSWPGFITNGTCLVNQTYQPDPGSLADFDGLDVNGTWTLEVSDHFFGDASDCDCDGFVLGPTCPRTLDEWSLTIDFEGEAGGGDDEEGPIGCREILLLLLLILILLAILWFLIKKARP